jgi:hypothetical protein
VLRRARQIAGPFFVSGLPIASLDGADLVGQVTDTVVVKCDLQLHFEHISVLHAELADEGRQQVPLDREGEAVELIAGGPAEAVQARQVLLQGGPVVVLGLQPLGLGLDLPAGLFEAGDELPARDWVEALAERPVVVGDLRVDLADAALDDLPPPSRPPGRTAPAPQDTPGRGRTRSSPSSFDA